MLTDAQRKEKATEMIAFMSAWGIPRFEAKQITIIMFDTLNLHLSDEEYNETGKQIAAFVQMMNGNKSQ